MPFDRVCARLHAGLQGATKQLSCQRSPLSAESPCPMLACLHAGLHLPHCGSCLLDLFSSPVSLQVESVAGSLADALHTAQVAADSACDAEIQLFKHLVDKAEALLQSPRAGGDGGFCASFCIVLIIGTVSCHLRQ